MTRWLPRSLFGQMLLILLAGMVVSHLVGTLIYASDRARAVRAIGAYAATQRIANLAQLIDEAPADWRERIVRAASDPTLRVGLSQQAPEFDPADAAIDATSIRDYLAEQLPAGLTTSLRVTVAPARIAFPHFGHHRPPGTWMPMMGGPGMMAVPPAGSSPFETLSPPGVPAPYTSGVPPALAAPPWMHAPGLLRSLRVAMRLSDGSWLSFATALPNAGPETPWSFGAAMLTMAVIVVLASAWAVRRVTAPLRLLAQAAERLGRDVTAPPIAEAGTTETRQAAHAFNQMQASIRRLVDNRTHMLAALSHDLRTPLTLLRLRTEALAEAGERDRMLATIGELDAMVGASLAYARDQAKAEAWRRTDVTALVGSIVDDMADAGLPVTMTRAEPVVLDCQPNALRRALTNLIDNAVKYGGTARVAIEADARRIAITIDDDGPGIPEAEMQRVFEPFHRLEASRSRETGGAGMGLSIAQSIVQAHGGDITLFNRPPCDGLPGLRATVTLPCDAIVG